DRAALLGGRAGGRVPRVGRDLAQRGTDRADARRSGAADRADPRHRRVTITPKSTAHAARRARAQEKLAAWGADAALITSLVNVRYLPGLASSNAALLLPARGPGVLATDFRYAEAAARDCGDLELVVERFIGPALASLAVARGMALLGFEAHVMTVEQHQELASLDGAPTLVDSGRLVEELRMVKDGGEIALHALCGTVNDKWIF